MAVGAVAVRSRHVRPTRLHRRWTEENRSFDLVVTLSITAPYLSVCALSLHCVWAVRALVPGARSLGPVPVLLFTLYSLQNAMGDAGILSALSELTTRVCPRKGGELMGIAAVPEQVKAYAMAAAALTNPTPRICEGAQAHLCQAISTPSASHTASRISLSSYFVCARAPSWL